VVQLLGLEGLKKKKTPGGLCFVGNSLKRKNGRAVEKIIVMLSCKSGKRGLLPPGWSAVQSNGVKRNLNPEVAGES